MIDFFFYWSGAHRDYQVLTRSVPTRRSSELLGPQARQNIGEKRLRQFDLRNMRVDVDAFDRGRRLHEREPACGRRRDILFKVEPIERAHIELRLAVAAAVGAAIGEDRKSVV